MKRMKRLVVAGCMMAAVLAAAATVTKNSPAADKDKPKANKKDAAVERARQTVKMLDDIYKTAVVLITDKYVNDEDDFPAGSAAVAWFDAINKKGWHKVRLLDATGEPYDEANTAKDEFEREAVKQLKAGKPYYEQIVKEKGKRTLRAATPIPVVMKKCIMCHEHYADAKEGEPIGLLSYTIEIK